MTDPARTAILARVREALRTARIPESDAPGRVEFTPGDALKRFREELDALGVASHLEESAAAVRDRVRSLIAEKRVLSWDSDRLPYDLGTILQKPTLGRSPRDEQARAEIGLTGCDAAIAETGSLVLLPDRGKSRTVSLLPFVHVAVVERNALCFSMGEFFRKHAESLKKHAYCNIITGPSRTADIELSLTLGVHGPGEVVVVIGP